MHILTPQWLTKQGLIESGTEVGFESDLTQPGFRYRFPKNKAIWSVSPNRLAIESQAPEIDCGQVAAKILQALPETPLFALGNNTHYEAERSERESLLLPIRDFPEIQPPSNEQSVLQRTFHVAINRSNHATTNLQIGIKEERIELACNVHNELAECEHPGSTAVNAAERFFEDRREAKSLAQHFFGTSIDHGPDNA